MLGGGVDDVLDLVVTATAGTFQEFARVVWHWNVGKVYGNVQKRETFPEIRNLGSVNFADGTSSLELSELISRSRYTGSDFAAITGEDSRLHRVVVKLTEGNRTLAIQSTDLNPEMVKIDLAFSRATHPTCRCG